MDEDEAETTGLREKVRVQETEISTLQIKNKDIEEVKAAMVSEKQSLESKLDEMFQAVEDLKKRERELENSPCHCGLSTKIEEIEDASSKKAKQIYDLTVQLGCIDLENKEFKAELKERQDDFQQRLQDQRERANAEFEKAQAEI